MKGIVLAAGKGRRMYPMTLPVCKPLLPVYDKPLIYYGVSTLIQAGIREILVIVPPNEEHNFARLLGNGSHLGVSISYAEQAVPRGIADALQIGRDFVGQDQVCLMLGDNIFHSITFSNCLKKAVENNQGATVFGYYVSDPRPFGVVEFDSNGVAISIEEKPSKPKSNYIIPGLYFYDQQVMDIVAGLSPSARGELEITDVNLTYLQRKQLRVIPLERDFIWMDAGTADNLLEASLLVKATQEIHKCCLGCLEEASYDQGWITLDQVHQEGDRMIQTPYGAYLKGIT